MGMKLLILQFVAPGLNEPLPTFSHNMGVLGAVLKADGFDVSLVALPGYHPQLLQSALERHKPAAILVETNPYSITAAHRTIGDIAAHRLPVVLCGQYASCSPSQAISIPGVFALLPGECETAGRDLFRALRDGGPCTGIPGTWVNTSSGLVKGPTPQLQADLDLLPYPDRELFNYDRLVQMTGQVGMKVARGCPMWCAYCVNDWYMDMYSGKGQYVRRRSVPNVLEEVRQVVSRYRTAGSVTIYDHCFAGDEAWLDEFARDYPRRCALPYRCHVPVGMVTERTAGLLRDSHSRWVHTSIGSGSRFIREEVHSLHAGNEQIVRACQMLRHAGLAVTAEVFVGSPYESEITVEETVDLLRRCQADDVVARVYYPTPGTRAAELCAENNWISGRGEENFWLQRSVLDMPSLPAAKIDHLAARLPRMVGRPGQNAIGKLINRLMRPRRRVITSL
ncbi:MAG: radical SAM protein [Planctomycetaceae bacterium]|nr:MAG: radical SAM protein [Planctomycetaceae bacterium]